MFSTLEKVPSPLQQLVNLSALLDAYLNGFLWAVGQPDPSAPAAAAEEAKEAQYEAWVVNNLSKLVSTCVGRMWGASLFDLRF